MAVLDLSLHLLPVPSVPKAGYLQGCANHSGILPQLGCLASDAGDVCILYSPTREAFSVQTGLSACSCYTLCLGQEPCTFRKFCPSNRKRFDCQNDPLLRDGEASPCPRFVACRGKLEGAVAC